MDSKNQKRNTEFDLFKLHVPNEDIGSRSYIKVYGKNLFGNLKIIINEILKQNKEKISHLSKRIAKRLNTHYDTVLKMLRNRSNDKWIAIPVIVELFKEWKISYHKSDQEVLNKKSQLQNYFEKFGCGSKEQNEVKVVRHLDLTLAKIAGAHLADGHLLKEKTFGGCSYKIIIIDEYKNNLEAFSRWLNDAFDINVKIEKAKCNAWKINIQNKIIGRYLEIFLDFPCGKKTFFDMPQIIQNSKNDIKEAFALGFMTFDGCVETDRSISLGIMCKKLRNQLSEILKENGLNIKKIKKKNVFHIKTSVLPKSDLQQWQTFFELNTEKWYKLNDMIHGFKGNVVSLDQALEVFSKTYNGTSTNKVNLKQIILMLKELNVSDKYFLANKLKVGVSTLYRYIHILENANILKRSKYPKKINLSNFHPSYVRVSLKRDFIISLFKKLKLKAYLRRQLATILGVSKTTVNNWAQYRHNIPLTKLKQLLTLANIELKDSNIVGFNRLVFTYNSNIKEWRVPYRPYLANHYI